MTRQEAIARQKNPLIAARLERMTEEEYQAHRAKGEAMAAAVAARLAREVV